MKPGFAKIQRELGDKGFSCGSSVASSYETLRICVDLINVTNGSVSPRVRSCPPPVSTECPPKFPVASQKGLPSIQGLGVEIQAFHPKLFRCSYRR